MKQQWGEAIRNQRETLGMTQKQLAEKVGCDQSAVAQWEKGATAPTVERQLAIAQALSVDARVLFQYPKPDRAA